MSDEKSPLEEAVERAMEAFVYAPIGLLFDSQELYPELVEKGRNQVNMARMMGQFAVETGSGEAAKALEKGRRQLVDVLGALGVAGFTPSRPTGPSRDGRSPRPRPPGGSGTAEPSESAVAVETLAIPDYDSLAASHVVSRLGGLSAAELEAVRAYEQSTRRRKTVLNKIAQLQA